MTTDELNSLRKLAAEATPGPWSVKIGRATFGDGTEVAYVMRDMPDPTSVIAYEVGLPEAAFIAAARSAVPALLDRVEELEKELHNFRRRVNAMAEVVAASNVLRSKHRDVFNDVSPNTDTGRWCMALDAFKETL